MYVQVVAVICEVIVPKNVFGRTVQKEGDPTAVCDVVAFKLVAEGVSSNPDSIGWLNGITYEAVSSRVKNNVACYDITG